MFERFSCVCLAVFCFALALVAPRAEARELKLGIEAYFAGQARTWGPSVVNPNNSVLHVPDSSFDSDLRPELKFSNEVTRIVVRPRFVFDSANWTEGAPAVKKQNSEGRLNLTDAYVENRFSDSLRLVTGLEVYQWGPAELYNASNPLFHLSTIGRSAFFKEKGQVLLRLSGDVTLGESGGGGSSGGAAGNQWSNMLILNPLPNNEPQWQADGQFSAGGFVKSELRSQDGASSLGGLAGTQPDGRRFFGEYGTLAFSSGWSIYLDARHPLGTRRYLPQASISGDLETLQTSDRLSSLALAGVRWEGRVDARLEYFYNSDGLSAAEFKSSLDTLRALSPNSPVNLARFLQPGLEIYGQHYLYASVRVPDLGHAKDISVSARVLGALQDGSSLLQASFEKPWSDSTVVLLEADATLGGDNQELTMFDRSAAFAGLKWTL